MFYYFCVDKRQVDLIKISKHFMQKLGIRLHADKNSDTVNGALYGSHYATGNKTGICWAGHDLSQIPEEHSCIVIEIYEEDESIGQYHKTNFKAKKVRIEEVGKEIEDYVKKEKLSKIKIDNQTMILDHNIERIRHG